MTDATPARDFLCEVADLAAFIDDVLALPRGSRWHWPSYYLFYAEVDRLQDLLVQTKWLFAPRSASLGEPATAQEEAECANELFARLGECQQAVIGWLAQMWRHTRTVTGRTAAHDRLEVHFHPKSGWYQLFRERYCAGRVAMDGATLERAVLGIDAGGSRHHIAYSSAECMVRHQSFDLRAAGTNAALADASASAQERLGRTLAAMGTLLAAHCTIADLLHPSSRKRPPRALPPRLPVAPARRAA